jgi:hypothetical protein
MDDDDFAARAEARMRMLPEPAVCCFCAKNVRREEGVALGVNWSEESVQGFVAHITCLKGKLHPEFAEYILP